MRIRHALLLTASALTLSAFGAEPVALFNGKDLTGWVKRGGTANFTVDGDAIVGASAPDTPNTSAVVGSFPRGLSRSKPRLSANRA